MSRPIGVTVQIAEWIAGFRSADLPDSARRVIRYALLDTLGCALHGRAQPWSAIVERWASDGAGGGPASIWGDGAPSLRPSDAALVNGVAAHAFELDDYHQTKLHPGAVVVPAALAVGERRDASADELLVAIAVGYEVMIRTAAALGPAAAKGRGWHITGITGTFGAAAAAAQLMRLDPARTAWALGLAGTQSSGLFAFNADGAMSKRFHAGHAARSGVAAAELAEAGLTGPTQIYQAEDGGFLWAFSDAGSETPLRDGLGQVWRLETTAFKPYAACGSTHAYIDAALQLRAKFGPPDDRRVRLGLCKLVAVQCGFDYHPGTALNAQMSVRYCVAAALLFGQLLPSEFTPERLADAPTVHLAGRIELTHDPALDAIYPEHFAAWVELERTPGAGNFEQVYLTDPSGSIANPHKEAAMLAKFHRLMAELMAADQARRLEAAVLGPSPLGARELVASLALERRSTAAE